MRARSAEWHEKYTLPSLWDFYEPSRDNHGSYYYDWTSWDEIAKQLLADVARMVEEQKAERKPVSPEDSL